MADQQKLEKFTITLPADEAARLRQEAQVSAVSMTDVVRRALATDAFIRKEIREDHKILVEEKPGQIKQVVFR